MAKIPNVDVKFTKNIGRPGLGAAGASTPAVQPSSAMLAGKDFTNSLIKTIGEQALEFNVAKQQTDLEQQQQAAIQDYLDRRTAGVNELQLEVSGLELAATDLIERGLEGSEDANPIIAQYKAKAERLKRAREQGVMSPMELSTRLLANTREAVAKYPGLYKELLSHSEKVLELTGIRSLVEMDQENSKNAAAAQDKMFAEIRELTRKYHIPFNYLNPSQQDYAKANEIISQIQLGYQATEALERAEKGEAAVTKQRATDWITNEYPNIIVGDATRLIDAFAETAPKSPNDYEQWIFGVRDAVDAAKSRVQSVVSRYNIVGDERVVRAVTEHSKSLDSLVARLEKLKSGEDAAAVMKNAYNKILDSQRLRLAENFDIAAIQALSLLPNLYEKHATKHNVLGLVQLLDGLVNNAVKSPRFQDGLSKDTLGEGKPDSIGALFGLLDSGQTQNFELGLDTMNGVAIDNPQFKTEEQKRDWLYSFVNEVASPSRKGAFANLSANGFDTAYKLIDEYVNMAAKWKDATIKRYEEQGIHIRANLTPTGTIVFESNDPRATRDMNKNFADPLNKSLYAIGNMMNMEPRQASELLATRYRQQIFGATNRDTGAIPMPITEPVRYRVSTPQEVDKAVQAGNMTKEEAEQAKLQMELDKMYPNGR